jgi:putative endonuclease
MKAEKSPLQAKNHQYGILAEEMVIEYLEFNQYEIIAHRYRCPYGEVDIIAKTGGALVFVEVKSSRRSINKEVLSKRQMRRISDSAAYFISENSEYLQADMDMRFDVVFCENKGFMHHIQNAWGNDEIFSC